MSQIIEVTVSPTGATQVETRGYVGNSCREASKFLEQALGLTSSETLTAEFHQSSATQTSVQSGQTNT